MTTGTRYRTQRAQCPACASRGTTITSNYGAALSSSTRSARGRAGWIIPALALALGVTAGCGSEQTYGAQEFVRAVDRQGVELRLGEPLTTDQEGKELYAVELEPLTGPAVDTEGDPLHAAGSLSVYEGQGGAADEFAHCRM